MEVTGYIIVGSSGKNHQGIVLNLYSTELGGKPVTLVLSQMDAETLVAEIQKF